MGTRCHLLEGNEFLNVIHMILSLKGLKILKKLENVNEAKQFGTCDHVCAFISKTAFEQDQDGTAVPSWSCSKAVYKPV